MRRIYKDCKVTQTKFNIVFGFYRGLSHLTGVRNTKSFFDSRDTSRITRNYEKYKNYKYLPVINKTDKNNDFDKKHKNWLSSMA